MEKNYLSREGYEKLDKELKDLKTRGRKEIAEEIAEARAKGDLSENAEYDAAKEAQGMLEKRIAELENALANARILDEEDINIDKAYLLSTVTIYNQVISNRSDSDQSRQLLQRLMTVHYGIRLLDAEVQWLSNAAADLIQLQENAERQELPAVLIRKRLADLNQIYSSYITSSSLEIETDEDD
ncbi:MAG: transcription elongation factor GreA [Balneolaceae bacterium]|nr:transcription elongation factor GreA [Balneolaceae bacterium]